MSTENLQRTSVLVRKCGNISCIVSYRTKDTLLMPLLFIVLPKAAHPENSIDLLKDCSARNRKLSSADDDSV